MQFNLSTLLYYFIEFVIKISDMQCTFINGIHDLYKTKFLQFYKIQGELL